jgi:hypothetical protein
MRMRGKSRFLTGRAAQFGMTSAASRFCGRQIPRSRYPWKSDSNLILVSTPGNRGDYRNKEGGYRKDLIPYMSKAKSNFA